MWHSVALDAVPSANVTVTITLRTLDSGSARPVAERSRRNCHLRRKVGTATIWARMLPNPHHPPPGGGRVVAGIVVIGAGGQVLAALVGIVHALGGGLGGWGLLGRRGRVVGGLAA